MPGEYDFARMQEEAARRAREMQARAHLPPRRRTQEPEAHREESAQTEPVITPPPAQESTQTEQTGPSVLDALFKDRERTMLLALLVLLSSEDGNHELLFALLFLLM